MKRKHLILNFSGAQSWIRGAICLLLAYCMGGSFASDLRWSAPATLPGDAGCPVAKIDARGNASVMYAVNRSQLLVHRYRSDVKAWDSRPTTLFSSTAQLISGCPKFVDAGDGNFIALWVAGEKIWTSRFTRGDVHSTWSAVEILADGGVAIAEVGAAGNGDAIVVWIHAAGTQRQVRAKVFGAIEARWSRSHTLLDQFTANEPCYPNKFCDYSLELAMSVNVLSGDAVALWLRAGEVVSSRFSRPSGQWTLPEVLSTRRRLPDSYPGRMVPHAKCLAVAHERGANPVAAWSLMLTSYDDRSLSSWQGGTARVFDTTSKQWLIAQRIEGACPRIALDSDTSAVVMSVRAGKPAVPPDYFIPKNDLQYFRKRATAVGSYPERKLLAARLDRTSGIVHPAEEVGRSEAISTASLPEFSVRSDADGNLFVAWLQYSSVPVAEVLGKVCITPC